MRLLVPLLLVACADPLDGLTFVTPDIPGAPLPGLSAEERAAFDAGDRLFETPFTDAQGVGPLYIRRACSSCHADDGRGPGFVDRMSGPPGTLPFGDAVRPLTAGGASTPVVPPEGDAVRVTRRHPPAVLGRGLLEAVRTDAIEALAAEQASVDDGVAGQIAWLDWPYGLPHDDRFAQPGSTGLLVGRFGHKGRSVDLDAFTAEAFQGDMGLTSPYLPEEIANPDALLDDDHPGVDLSAEVVHDVAAYVRLLAMPERPPLAQADLDAFADVGCATCHVPSLPTRDDHPTAALAGVDAALFTDVLLHRLGPANDDGVFEGAADGAMWRTAPLIGLRFQTSFLHDGRATSLDDAVDGHGGEGSEAQGAVDAWHALSAADRARLTDFVLSL